MKRAKLIAGLLSCMMCLAMLTIGVWAVASVATLDINGNLKFYPEGLFVQLSGEVYRGNSSTESEMTKLTDPRFTYGPVANFDNIQDELSGNFPLEAWEIGNVAFIPNQRFIKIKVYITNYSDFAITGTPTVTIGGQDISETITGLTVTSNTSEIWSITSNTTATYELVLEVTGNTEFSKSVNVSFEFIEYEAKYYTCNWSTSSRYANIGFQILVDNEVKINIDGTLNASGSFQILEGSVITYISGVDTQTLSIEPRSPSFIFNLGIYDAKTNEQLARYDYMGFYGGHDENVEGFPLTVTSDINIIVEESSD